MSRSFQIVEDKIEEAEFFLDKLHSENTDSSQFNFRAVYFYLSAFLSAVRSITFCLQASLKGVEGFESWYQEQQNKLRDSELARFFLEARNLSQKVGYYPIGGGRISKDENGTHHVEFYFDQSNEEGLKFIPNTDVVTACETQFRQLLEIAASCYNNFGTIIDPEKYYTVENMTEKGMTVEDFETELGYEKGWTQVEGLTIADRINLLNSYASQVTIDWIFVKHLGTDRYGNPVVSNLKE